MLLGIDPADSSGDVLLSASLAPSQSLTRVTGMRATITQTSSMSEVMRASRTVENEVIIAPAHVTASAILHAYQLLATSGQEQIYVLVAKSSIDAVDKLPGKRIYLPQQDSLRSYVAKGLLTESGVKLAQFSKVTYGNTSGGGLVALGFGMADVTIADETQAKEWIAAHPGQGRILKATRPVPGGMSMVVRKDFCASDCSRLSDWVTSGEGTIPGVGKFRLASADAGKQFTYVASLGITTPDTLKGVTRVSAEEVAELAKQNVTIVDTRSQKEYDSEHVRGAILASYLEKSLKEVDFDASKDDFSRPEGGAQGQAGRLLLQRARMLEVVQGVACRGRRRLSEDLLVPRRHARVARQAPAGRRHVRRGAGQDPGGAEARRQGGRRRAVSRRAEAAG